MERVTTVEPLLILNLNDSSGLLFLQGNYSLDQDMTLDFGASINLGGRGTEYGGIESAAGSGIYFDPADQVYARLSYYY